MNAEFVSDPFFYQLVKRYLGPPVLSKKPFSFIDLPTALRLMVAHYALAADGLLFWIWIDKFLPAGGRIDKCEDLEDTAALCRVSRKVHQETLPIIWKVNTFAFCQIGLSIPGDFGISTLRSAYELFSRSLSFCQLDL